MVPKTLEEWSLEKIKELLTSHYMEQETFDWKEMLPDSRNQKDKDGLRKDCCAFANSNGGFLVFGVQDKGNSPEQRMVGIDPVKEFAVEFGNFPSKCNPSVQWEPRNPPITLVNGNVIHVVWIPRSWNGPHSIDKDEGFLFPKRTNRGNEFMNYEEIRMFFLGYYEKRMKLHLLCAELATIQVEAKDSAIPKDQWNVDFPLKGLNVQVLESVLVDVYSILRESKPLVESLLKIRIFARDINSRIAYVLPMGFQTSLAEGGYARAQVGRQNEAMSPRIDDLVKEVDVALRLLIEFLCK